MQQIKPWMFRRSLENLYLFLTLAALIIISYLFSLINVFWFVILLIGVLIYIQLEQARYLGNAMRVHKNQFPDMYEMFVEVAKKLGITKANLYIRQDPVLNAHAIGIGTCSVVLSSSLVEQLTKTELQFVIGHELGHYAAGHTKISSLLIPLDFGNSISNLVFGVWQREGEYSCDQCGLIITKDLDAAVSAIIKLTIGGNLFHKVNIKGYLDQVRKADTTPVKLSELLISHPVSTNRVKNLIKFWKMNFEQL